MTPIDDDRLASQLTRRAGGLSGAAARVTVASDAGRRIAATVAQRVSTERQAEPRPWHRVLGPGALRSVERPERLAALAAVALVALLGAIAILPGLVGSAPEPTSVPGTGWYLTTPQLEHVAARAAELNLIGKTIVADVRIVVVSPSCPSGIRCPQETVVAGTDPPLVVTNGILAVSCVVPLSGPTPCLVPPLPGPTALTLRGTTVEWLATLGLDITQPQVFTVGSYLSSLPTQPEIVDGWLSSTAAPRCLAPAPSLPLNDRSPCLAGAWLTASSYQESLSGVPPEGIQMQPGGYQSFAPDPLAVDSTGLPMPERALYLIEAQPTPYKVNSCNTCSAVARVLARIDPIPIETAPGSVASAAP